MESKLEREVRAIAGFTVGNGMFVYPRGGPQREGETEGACAPGAGLRRSWRSHTVGEAGGVDVAVWGGSLRTSYFSDQV